MFVMACAQLGCKKSETSESLPLNGAIAATNAQLVAYKNTPHQLSVGFYRTWRDRTVSGNANDPIMSELPDSLDIAIVFTAYTPGNSPYWTALKNEYIPALHAKGTKVIYTGSIGLLEGATSDSAGYAATAQAILARVAEYNFDGFDIDIERQVTGTELQDLAGVYHELSKYLGPKSGTSKLLTFDTNQSGTNNLFRQINTELNYVFLQAYGRNVSSLQTTWATFAPYIRADQFLIGFSFYEENGYPSNYWNDVTYPQNGTGRAYDYARWQPTGSRKGGVFSYAIDRDAPLSSFNDNNIITPNFRVTNDLIKVMNP